MPLVGVEPSTSCVNGDLPIQKARRSAIYIFYLLFVFVDYETVHKMDLLLMKRIDPTKVIAFPQSYGEERQNDNDRVALSESVSNCMSAIILDV